MAEALVSPGGIARIELLPGKELTAQSAWSAVDLDDAEETHIFLAQQEEACGGPKVINQYRGRNGPSSATPHLFLWQAD